MFCVRRLRNDRYRPEADVQGEKKPLRRVAI